MATLHNTTTSLQRQSDVTGTSQQLSISPSVPAAQAAGSTGKQWTTAKAESGKKGEYLKKNGHNIE